MQKKLMVDVWSDVACPWCWVGKRRLEKALSQFAHRDDVSVVWHAFELDTSAPKEVSGEKSHAARIAEKYGTTEARAQEMIDGMTQTARADGLDFHFEKARSGNTFDAHRVIHLAHERGVQDAVKERLFRGYMSEGELMSDAKTLARLGGEAGLDAGEVERVLASDTYAGDVRADERAAREMGVRGVPFFVLGGKYAISGAQPADVILKALDMAWQDASQLTAVTSEDANAGDSCGPDGCAL